MQIRAGITSGSAFFDRFITIFDYQFLVILGGLSHSPVTILTASLNVTINRISITTIMNFVQPIVTNMTMIVRTVVSVELEIDSEVENARKWKCRI